MPGENKLHTAFKYVDDLWDDAEAAKLDSLGRLVYRSNKLGSDLRITNTGGGNTSAKLSETDPLTKQPVPVLWVKGSGGDLRTSTRENFSSLYQDKLLALQKLYTGFRRPGPRPGPKMTWWRCSTIAPSTSIRARLPLTPRSTRSSRPDTWITRIPTPSSPSRPRRIQ